MTRFFGAVEMKTHYVTIGTKFNDGSRDKIEDLDLNDDEYEFMKTVVLFVKRR